MPSEIDCRASAMKAAWSLVSGVTLACFDSWRMHKTMPLVKRVRSFPTESGLITRLKKVLQFSVSSHKSAIIPIYRESSTWRHKSQNQSIISRHFSARPGPGDVLELADKHDLGSCAARRVGSTPTIPTW